jgi:hypothetical protein
MCSWKENLWLSKEALCVGEVYCLMKLFSQTENGRHLECMASGNSSLKADGDR